MALQPGERIGDYEITGILGAGGMGMVYKVRNVLSDRTEAMKVLLPALTENRELSDRFLREIRVLASFDHPHIASLHTAQHADGQILMVMECIEGLSLDALLKRGHLTLAHSLDFCAQVLEALQYAHERGVVHRDLKPANIMVTKSGAVKLMDFGIAKLAADPKLTSTGTTFGSLRYMSPEQIQGAANVDARSDIYSMGVCLYEMVTGQPPFDADSEYSLMSAHLNQAPPPPIQIDPKVAPALSQFILKALLKDPAFRFQSAAEMLVELNRLRVELGLQQDRPTGTPILAATPAPEPETRTVPAPVAAPVPVAEARPRSRRTLYIALGSLATAAALVAALFLAPYLSRTSATGAPAQPSTVQPSQPTPAPSSSAVPITAPPRSSDKKAVTEPPPREVAQTPPQKDTRAVPLRPTEPAPAAVITPPQPATQPEQPPSAPPPARAAELNQVRNDYNQLAIRAATAKTGLQSLQNQMGGLGLRADMREAAARADYLMQEAMTAIRSGDIENARRNIDLADRTVEKIEKFLGR